MHLRKQLNKKKFSGLAKILELIELRILNRLSVEQCAQLFEVSQRTWRAWERGEKGRQAPRAVYLVLEYRIGDLSQFGLPGWQLSQGKFINPQGLAFTPAEVDTIPWLNQLIAAYKREQRDAKKQNQLTNASNDFVLDKLKFEIE